MNVKTAINRNFMVPETLKISIKKMIDSKNSRLNQLQQKDPVAKIYEESKFSKAENDKRPVNDEWRTENENEE